MKQRLEIAPGVFRDMPRARVGISVERDEEHEWRCITAIRRRQHPAWSRLACGFRVA